MTTKLYTRYCNWHLRGSTATNYHAGTEKVLFAAPRDATSTQLFALAADLAIDQILFRTLPRPDRADVVICGIRPSK